MTVHRRTEVETRNGDTRRIFWGATAKLVVGLTIALLTIAAGTLVDAAITLRQIREMVLVNQVRISNNSVSQLKLAEAFEKHLEAEVSEHRTYVDQEMFNAVIKRIEIRLDAMDRHHEAEENELRKRSLGHRVDPGG